MKYLCSVTGTCPSGTLASTPLCNQQSQSTWHTKCCTRKLERKRIMPSGGHRPITCPAMVLVMGVVERGPMTGACKLVSARRRSWPRAVRGPQREKNLPLVETKESWTSRAWSLAVAPGSDAGAHGCALTQHREPFNASIAKVLWKECCVNSFLQQQNGGLEAFRRTEESYHPTGHTCVHSRPTSARPRLAPSPHRLCRAWTCRGESSRSRSSGSS